MSTRSLYPLLLFFLLDRSINDTQQTFWGFTFAEIPSKNTLISQLISLHFDLQNGWLVGYYFFEVNRTSKVGHIWPLEIMFRPHLACISPCWRNGLDVCGTIQPSGDCTLGFFLELCSAALKLRRV